MEKKEESPEEVKKINAANDKLFADLASTGEKLTGVELKVPATTRRKQGVVTLGATSESAKLKKKMLFGEKSTTKEKLPDHIRKAYIIINDKKLNNPIEIKFSGVWTGSDINLAGKHLILDYQVYVRNRAIRGK